MNLIFKFALLAFVLTTVVLFPAKSSTYGVENKQNLEFSEVRLPKIVEARSALVLDLLTGKINFQKNIYEPLPLASLTKIVSSLVVLDNIDPNEYIEISQNAILTPEPSSLKVGEYLRAEDLLAMSMGESSNDAMMALVEKFGDEKWFLELMRLKSEELGATGMKFLNPTGLDIEKETRPSNFGSAWDLAQVVKYSLDSVIWQIGQKNEVVSREGIVHKLKHTNALRSEVTGIVGDKTGFTDNAGGNLILIVERPLGQPKLIIILGSTLEGRFEDAKRLIQFYLIPYLS